MCNPGLISRSLQSLKKPHTLVKVCITYLSNNALSINCTVFLELQMTNQIY